MARLELGLKDEVHCHLERAGAGNEGEPLTTALPQGGRMRDSPLQLPSDHKSHSLYLLSTDLGRDDI